MSETLKILELFAGIGACSKALENLDIPHTIVDAVEIEPKAICSFNAIHNTNFEAQNITEWDKDIQIDLIMHGSPCQDFSIAGKQAGGDEGTGTRSSLMYETVRIVEKLKPKYVVWENVKNLISDKHKHNFDNYINQMGNLGYNSYYRLLNSKNYGIPQNRERIFTISIRKDIDDGTFRFPEKQRLKIRLKDLLDSDVDIKYYLTTRGIDEFVRNEELFINHKNIGRTHIRNTLLGEVEEDPQCIQVGNLCGELWDKGRESCLRIYSTEGISPTLMTFHGQDTVKVLTRKHGVSEPHQSNQVFSSEGIARTLMADDYKEPLKVLETKEGEYRIRKLTPLEYYRLQGFNDEDFHKAKKALNDKFFNGEDRSNSALYTQAGNSITVNVLMEIFKKLFKKEN